MSGRYFAVFLVFQAMVLGASMFYNEFMPAIVAGAVVAVLFVIGVLLKP